MTGATRASLAALLVLATTQGCQADGPDLLPIGGQGSSQIRVLAAHGATLGIPRVPREKPVVVGWVNVCLVGDQPQRIERVRAVGSEHARVVDFALRDNPLWDDGETYTGRDVEFDWPHGLEQAGFDRAAKTVTLACDERSGRAHQLGIEIEVTGPDKTVGVIESFEVEWSGGRAPLPLTVLLCPFATAYDARCEARLPS